MNQGVPEMENLPWMRPDFDLRKVLAADASGAFRASLEHALDDLAGRLERQRSVCRDMAARERLDALLDACDAGRNVLAAACEAVQQA
jgi:hypothetical protein